MTGRIVTACSGIVLMVATLHAAPEIRWVETVHDFGTFNEADGKVTTSFRFVNAGDEPVHVLEARATCGCTRPDFDGKAVMPGDTASITVSYDPQGRPGRFSKKVYVDMDTSPSRHTLVVKGSVIGAESTVTARYPDKFGPLRLKSNMMVFGPMTNHDVRSTYIEAYNNTTDTVRPYFSDVPGHIHLMVSPQAVAPGEQAVFSATLYGEEAPMYGLVNGSVTLHPDGDRAGSYRIPVTAVINEDFSSMTGKELANAPVATLSDAVMDFGTVNPGDAPLSRTVTLTNDGKNTLIVRRIQVGEDADFTVDPLKSMKIKRGKRVEITATVDPARLAGKELLNDKITLITNDPGKPAQTIRVIAEVR